MRSACLMTLSAILVLLGCPSEEPQDDDTHVTDDDDDDTRIIDLGDDTIEVRTFSGQVNLTLPDLDPEELQVTSALGGSSGVAPDGTFEVELSTTGLGLVSLSTLDGQIIAVVAQPVHPWLVQTTVIFDEVTVMTSVAYTSSWLMHSDPVLSAVVLHRLGGYLETELAADALSGELADDPYALSQYSSDLVEAVAAIHDALATDIGQAAVQAGHDNPFPNGAQGTPSDNAPTPQSGVVAPDDPGAANDAVDVTATWVSDTELHLDFLNRATRWVVVHHDDDRLGYVPPTVCESDMGGAIIDGILMFAEEALETVGELLSGEIPDDDWEEHWEELRGNYISEGHVETYPDLDLTALPHSQVTLTAFGCNPECPSAGDEHADRWALAGIATLYTELAVPGILAAGNLPDSEAIGTLNLEDCFSFVNSLPADAQTYIYHLDAMQLAFSVGDRETAIAHFGECLSMLLGANFYDCFNLPMPFDVGWWEDNMEELLEWFLETSISFGLMAAEGAINLLGRVIQVHLGMSLNSHTGVYDIYLAEICSDGVDNDSDGYFDCGDLDCAGDPACPVEILSIDPSTVTQGQQELTIAIEGNNFLSNGVDPPRLSFGDSITVTSAAWVSTIELTAQITVECEATPGTRTVEFAQPDEDYGSDCSSDGRACFYSFTVVEDPMCGLSPEDCSDGIDNDGDGDIDCDDPDCYFDLSCMPACANNVDDDWDGWVDLDDPGCAGDPNGTDEGGYDLSYECNDGIDNDGDGWTDVADPECGSATASEFFPSEVDCTNGVDDDNDGDTDCDDPDCYFDLACIPACANQLDDDGDGWTDLDDPGCGGDADWYDEGGYDLSYECNDGIDNDGDGYVDGDDVECGGVATGSEFFPSEVDCTDGVDDDNDGDTDCNDMDCVLDPSCIPACSNALDDDGDGWLDLDDPGCAGDPNGTDEGGYDATFECNDGIDNDGDGWTDRDDPECVDATADEDEPVETVCDDGLDGDGDGDVDCDDSDCAGDPACPLPNDWVSISGGVYDMGMAGFSEAEPVHSVTMPSFEMWRTEVTVEQYTACVNAGYCTEPGTLWVNCNWSAPGYEEHPMNCVDWDQAVAFCSWVGSRLPSESEWEYSARSRGQFIDFPWGNSTATCDYAVMDDDTHDDGCDAGRTWTVCSKSAGNSDQGLCDMAGNVWEWVQDWYHNDYNGAPTDGSAWEVPAGSDRVVRGGGYNIGSQDYLNASNRVGVIAGFARSGSDVGFRCAR